MQLFTPNHVKLFNSCYPPTHALPTAVTPNAHELSRLTYYASNHPGKLTKLGGELDKRFKTESRKAKSGNIRSRSSLLISLAILRSLATECRRDIALLSPTLISSIECTLISLPNDLEVVAQAASVFTTWTTYTNGHLIGADSSMTNEYISILNRFATLSASKSSDQETQNRMRLIGLAALTAAINSEALYNDMGHFGLQVSTIIRPIIIVLFETSITVLDDQACAVKDTNPSPYLAEFRTRPTLERRAASIHAHIDGDQGPSTSDVSDASLHALFSLLSHTNGTQLGYIMQSTFNSLDALPLWTKLEHCCWYAQKTAEWAQYQYRHVVPTWLVERLLSHQNLTGNMPVQKVLIAMITSVFSSSTPFINLSSSDIMSNLLTLLLRSISANPADPALSSLVECISSLGCHVYYSDQIQDLAGELINRLVLIEVQGLPVSDKSLFLTTRSTAIRYFLESLVGLVQAATASENPVHDEELPTSTRKIRSSIDKSANGRPSRRTKVSPEIWQDTLSLLCDADILIRKECASTLLYYIAQEMPKHGELNDTEGSTHLRKAGETSFRHAQNTFPNVGDAGSKFLNAVHGYVYILAISPTLSGPSSSSSAPENNELPSTTNNEEHYDLAESSENPTPPQSTNRRSLTSQHVPRARKESLVLRLLEKIPTHYTTSAKASEEDYANILKILTTIHIQLPMHGLLTGVPMLLALEANSEINHADVNLLQRIITVKTVISHIWRVIGQVWQVPDLVNLAEQTVNKLTAFSKEDAESFSGLSGLGIDRNVALSMLVSSRTVQEAFKIDRDSLSRRLFSKWTPELALRDFESLSGYENTFRGDGVSPLLKISPALMHIENLSLQSLARSTRGLGVTDLREALEGRSGMSNPALVRPPSVSTLDHASSYASGDIHNIGLSQTRSRSRTKKRSGASGAGEVRDVLTRLGISKQNGSLLKATFPVRQKS